MSIAIPKNVITSDNIKTMEKKLYVQKEIQNNHTHKFFQPEKVPFFRICDEYMYVPFFWGKHYFGDKYQTKSNMNFDFDFHGELREEQSDLKQEAMESLQKDNCVLLSCYPGFGKTVLALDILKDLKKKTLIIVNKLVLIEQWRESIETYLQITPTIIKGKGSKIKNSSIYIINSINITKHDFSDLGIGTVITDECHLILTTCFSRGFFHVQPEYLIGLSATPYRLDGFDILFDMFFGYFRIHRNLYKPHDIIQVVTKEKIEHTVGKLGINWNSVIEHQSTSLRRKNLICDFCTQYKDRNILILCKRIQQMDDIHEELKNRQEDSQVFKENDVSFDKNTRILISSFQKCGTGFSFNKLNMLILGTDTKDFYLQYLGRVFRNPKEEVRPLIIDIVDDHPLLKRHFLERKKVYLEAGGEIKRKNVD